MATKTIILVRHGQYHPKSEKTLEKLTTLGRKQAKLAGKRLKENQKIDRIVHSTMPRAIETMNIIKKGLGYRGPIESTNSLREGVPGYPAKLRKKKGFKPESMAADKKRIERAFKKYFKPSRKDTLEVLVCHGNVIRYLVCRSLGVDSDNWRKMDILQCAISVVVLRSKGDSRIQVISHNDVGHLPKKHRTFL